ncbi:hypothetical protein EYF80_045436 [Liparis tanakae]|uniref:Uncharacterized protein n=1 Tax=Liparis tanakae TaxID=230148 RepID=A0A4Z2FU02_9TELE|nr:hypothetical protein EYF80_045436 [Liparis tanakae]
MGSGGLGGWIRSGDGPTHLAMTPAPRAPGGRSARGQGQHRLVGVLAEQVLAHRGPVPQGSTRFHEVSGVFLIGGNVRTWSPRDHEGNAVSSDLPDPVIKR